MRLHLVVLIGNDTFFSFLRVSYPQNQGGKSFPGSMGPKIEAAIKFVEESENPNAWAAIGDMKDAAKIMSNEEGTIVRKASVPTGVVWRERVEKESSDEKDERPGDRD